MDCYHGFIQPETTLQQALLDLRLFIQTEYFVTVSSCELYAVQIKSYFLHCSSVRLLVAYWRAATVKGLTCPQHLLSNIMACVYPSEWSWLLKYCTSRHVLPMQ